MANGQGSRWGGHLGRAKHLIEIGGETLLRRIARQVGEVDPGADVVISSSSASYETEGARRHEPLVNELEIDRFVPELFSSQVCFLYGDTYYSDEAIAAIVGEPTDGMLFFGDERGIVAVKSHDQHALTHHFTRVRDLFLAGEIDSCIGWQLYQSYAGLEFGRPSIGDHFVRLTQFARGFNTPGEYEEFARNYQD